MRHRLTTIALLLLALCARAADPDPGVGPKGPDEAEKLPPPKAKSGGHLVVPDDEAEKLPPPKTKTRGLLVMPPDDDEDRVVSPLVGLKAHLHKLKEQRDALHEERVKAAQALQEPTLPETAANAQLRLRLGSLLTQLGTRREGPRPFVRPPSTDPKPPEGPIKNDGVVKLPPPPKHADSEPAPAFAKALDPLALAQALFRAGNFDGALKAYRMLPEDGLRADERAPVQYMMASCLRKLGKLDEAADLYRKVANVRGDEELAQCAQWQLQAMRWQKEMTDQLKELRQRRLAVEGQP